MRASKITAILATLIPFAAYGQNLQFRENHDPAVIDEAKANIVSTGQPCPSISNVWNIIQNEQTQPAYKVSCSNSTDYQLTIIGSKIYVKPWTGNILGQ